MSIEEGSTGRAVGTSHIGAQSVSELLAAARADSPQQTFLRTADRSVTYAAFADEVEELAAGLTDLGVHPGQVVALLMDTSVDQVAVWFALARHGNLHVPINPALHSEPLRHALASSGASVVVVDDCYLADLVAVAPALPQLSRVIVRGSPAPMPTMPVHVATSSYETLSRPKGRAPEPTLDPLATGTVLFTSGSTGMPKPCALSHRYLAAQGQLHAYYLGFRPDDVLYTCFPLFHIDGACLTVVAALAARCTAALSTRFSARNFWAEVQAFEATVFNFMGMTQTVLWRRPPGPEDRAHRVRMAWGVPMPPFYSKWRDRFGFDLLEVFGSTDAGVFAYDRPGEPHVAGSAGRVIDEYQVRIVDGHGTVPAGVAGEIQVRGIVPGLTMSGYHDLPEATAAAIDDEGWVRTGDRGWLDADGRLRWLGRLGDSIRRRGENISAAEVEAALVHHPDIVECVAVGVPSELMEEDLKVCIVPTAGADLRPQDVMSFARDRLPPFMVPRYVEIRSTLPLTPTQKVARAELRSAEGCFDSESTPRSVPDSAAEPGQHMWREP